MTPIACVILFVAIVVGAVAWFILGDKDAD